MAFRTGGAPAAVAVQPLCGGGGGGGGAGGSGGAGGGTGGGIKAGGTLGSARKSNDVPTFRGAFNENVYSPVEIGF